MMKITNRLRYISGLREGTLREKREHVTTVVVQVCGILPDDSILRAIAVE